MLSGGFDAGAGGGFWEALSNARDGVLGRFLDGWSLRIGGFRFECFGSFGGGSLVGGRPLFGGEQINGGEAGQGLATEQSHAAIFGAIWILFLAEERCNQVKRRQEPSHP